MRPKIVGLVVASVLFVVNCTSGVDDGPFACAPGTQDRDGDGLCLAACGPGICEHGACDDADGTVSCKCDAEHAGLRCDRCAPDYIQVGNDKGCVPGCAHTACGHGKCIDCGSAKGCLGEAPRCECDSGYGGDLCEVCVGLFTRGPSDTCVPAECDTNPCGPGKCTPTDFGKVCTCPPAYAGAYCEVCNVGHHMAGALCVPD